MPQASKPLRVGLAWQMDRRYGEEAIRGIAEYSKRYGPWLFFMNRLEDFDVRRVGDPPDFDGIIVGDDDLRRLKGVRWSRKIPVVSVHMVHSEVAPWRIQPDNAAVGRLAAEEFLRLGLGHFAFCPHSSADDFGGDAGRYGGFAACLRESGMTVSLYDRPVSRSSSHRARPPSAPLARWLSGLTKPVGILIGSDQRARDVFACAESVGVRIPEDAALISVNNEAWAEVLFRGLSSIELDGFAAGYAAAQVLHRVLEGERVEPGVTFVPPRRLVIRRSSSRVAVDDPDIATAVSYIAEHATVGIGVDEVVDAVPLSRRSLERRFHQYLGHSILHEIHRTRVERAKLLLPDKSVSLSRIADVCGFGSLKSMRIIFRRIAGISPAEYRAQSTSGNA